MKTRNLCFALILFVLAGCSKKNDVVINNGGGKVSDKFLLGSTLQSNMVIQRDKPLVIWGNVPAAGLAIAVTVSWNNTTFNTTAGSSGSWRVIVPASAANSNPQTITVKANKFDPVVLTNVLIGDVWICAGQSNMVMPLDAIAPFTGVLDYQNEIAAANFPQIRTFTTQSEYETSPVAYFKTSPGWDICSPANAGNLSAIAYYFARKLNTSLNVPVGVIVSAINGSYGQEWTNAEAINGDPLVQRVYSGDASQLYNGMINPLTNLNIKGFIWYQGENNQHDDAPDYTKLNAALINGWRSKFNDNGLPFYLVQLTPFAEDYNTTTPKGGDPTLDYLAKFREQQANVLTVPGTGMAVTMDVGEEANHHPRNKKPVGERLALLALKNNYGQQVECYGPHFSSYTVNGNTATINFTPGTANGLNTIGSQPLKQFFFVAGVDKVFRQASAVISGNIIIVTAPADLHTPIQAIRYAFTNAPVTNLQNSAGLPAEPFRTDNWDN
jgi:sialate O-acetylesterase